MRPDFPGMDPWLEHPALWPDVHNRLIAAIADAIVPAVDPRYIVAVEGRMTIYAGTEGTRSVRPDVAITPGDRTAPMPGRPDEAAVMAGGLGVAVLEVDLPLEEGFEVNETYLEIRELETGELVTTIEVLSPANKSPGRGQEQYLAKRDEVLRSASNLVEIDLLRGGMPMPLARPVEPSAYRILVSRGTTRPKAQYFAFGVRAAIPPVPVPLKPGDPEPMLDLNRVLNDLIDRARYFRRVDYDRPPVPPLGEAEATWAGDVIARAV